MQQTNTGVKRKGEKLFEGTRGLAPLSDKEKEEVL
jgi:hypothetical protein